MRWKAAAGGQRAVADDSKRTTDRTLFAAFGVKGTSAEAVANPRVAHEARRRYLASPAAVGEHLADQLIYRWRWRAKSATVARASGSLAYQYCGGGTVLPVRFSCEATESSYLVRVATKSSLRALQGKHRGPVCMVVSPVEATI
ncbi:hypothetical protein KCP74_07545 [Salmonella enterica subsp. enterica]|nr:hypothetical protein KCP74_07545 [Salmonella enterica subsp. enterica]